MKALVTGATGFIGGHVARALLSKGYSVRALVRPGQAMTWRHESLSVAVGDVRDEALPVRPVRPRLEWSADNIDVAADTQVVAPPP